jgi:hypothetical protein
MRKAHRFANDRVVLPQALLRFVEPAIIPCATASNLSRLSDKSSTPVPLHGPPLLAFICVWLNTAGLHGGLFRFSLEESIHQKVADGLSRL